MDLTTPFYRVAYRIGFHPWEDLADHPPFANKLTELFEREERGRQAPYGAALDLGCGSAVWGVELARRGWQVTSVDIVDKARARERARADDVELRVMHGDVTDLATSDVGSGRRDRRQRTRPDREAVPVRRALLPAPPRLDRLD
ncbi:MAG: class I SAM-dependent methyltransferase [Solirubrobacterales bacterium]